MKLIQASRTAQERTPRALVHSSAGSQFVSRCSNQRDPAMIRSPARGAELRPHLRYSRYSSTASAPPGGNVSRSMAAGSERSPCLELSPPCSCQAGSARPARAPALPPETARPRPRRPALVLGPAPLFHQLSSALSPALVPRQLRPLPPPPPAAPSQSPSPSPLGSAPLSSALIPPQSLTPPQLPLLPLQLAVLPPPPLCHAP